MHYGLGCAVRGAARREELGRAWVERWCGDVVGVKKGRRSAKENIPGVFLSCMFFGFILSLSSGFCFLSPCLSFSLLFLLIVEGLQ